MKEENPPGRSFRRVVSALFAMRGAEKKKKRQDFCRVEPDVKPAANPTWKCFSYEKLHEATNGFHQENLVGSGGYAEVYRGELAGGEAVAVKRLTRAATDEQKEKEFLTELGIVGHVRHPNVVSLLGCCIDRDLYLVFEFSPRGSVSANIHSKRLKKIYEFEFKVRSFVLPEYSHGAGEDLPPLAWKLRRRIALGTAEGLHYLHKVCRRRIIHRDIKASNILLSANFEPQISDFGLARWLPSEWTHRAIAPIEGTFGCLAPEYFTHGIVDEKTDVFAFGVFLLELISGRKPVDGSHRSLLSWAKPFINEGKTELLVDPRLGDDYDVDQVRRLAFVASLCIRAGAIWRPSMTEVLHLIEGAEISAEQWNMPAEQEEDDDDELWDLDDLDDECDTPTSQSSSLSSSMCGSYLPPTSRY